MRFNSIEEIIKVIEKPFASALLVEARESQAKHKLHITGEGFDELVGKRIKGLESDKNFDVKQEVARPTTTRIYKQILNQYQKVFRAKGFFKKYKFKNNDENLVDDFKSYLNNVSGGLSLDQLMQIVWFKASFEEFNGVFLVDLPVAQENELAEPFIHFKEVDSIHDILVKGDRVEYIIFKWEEMDKNRKVIHYRVIDDSFDYHFVEKNGKPVLATKMVLNGEEFEEVEDIIPNIWGYVPAIQPSQLTKRIDNDTLKKSFIEETMSDADAYLSVSNDHAVSVKLHQHPIFYAFDAMCDSCGGDGDVEKDGGVLPCVTCKGSGSVPFWKKDTTQGISVPAPREEEEWGNVTVPAGYINIDNDTILNQIVEMDREEALIEKGALGTDGILTSVKKQETATGKEIDTQPLFDTLTNFSNNGQFNEEFLTNALGVARYNSILNDTGTVFEGSIILWGKQFFIRSTQVIEKEYLEAKEAGAPDYFLKGLLEELNFTKYDNNPKAKQRSVILSILEPFVVKTVEEVKVLGVDVVDLTLKTYFNDFIEKFELENIDVVDFMSNAPFKSKIIKIEQELFKYSEDKIAQIAERNVVIKVDVEAEAKANLRGSVGGIQGVIAIQESVATGVMKIEAAEATIVEFYGVKPEVAKSMLSKTTIKEPIIKPTNNE